MEAKSSAKYLRGSAQKTRLVVDLIRGKSVSTALAMLQFTNKRAAGHVEQCVRSAIANATETAERNNIAVDPDDLWIKSAYVDQGPSKGRYRMRPAPQGRAFREKRHFCHVTVLLSSDERVEKNKKGKIVTPEELARREARRKQREQAQRAAPKQTVKASDTKAQEPTIVAAPPVVAAEETATATPVTTSETVATTETTTETTNAVDTAAVNTSNAPSDNSSADDTTTGTEATKESEATKE